MPIKAAEEIDSATIGKAGAWSLEYFLDPKRGGGKRFPTKEQIHAQFPDLKLTSVEQVENWVFQKVGTTNLESISHNPQRATDIIKEVKEEKRRDEKKEAVLAPVSLKEKPTSFEGTLDEIDLALAQHKKQTGQALTATLNPQVKSFIASVAPKSLNQQQIDQLTAQIVAEVSRETMVNVPKVVDMSQAPDVITDSLVSTVLAEPALIPNPQKQNIGKLIEKAAPLAAQVAATHAKDLEKLAVLENISRISSLEKTDSKAESTIDQIVDQTIESQHPLASKTETAALKTNLKSYLQDYAKDFRESLKKETGGKIPSFATLQKVQEVVHQKTAQKFHDAVTQSLGAQAASLTSKVNLPHLTDQLAVNLRLRPLSRAHIETMGLGSAQPNLNTFTKAAPGWVNWGTGLALATNTNFQTQAFLSAMAANGQLPQQARKLEVEAQALQAELKLQGSLSYEKTKRLKNVGTRLQVMTSALGFKTKQPKQHQTFVSWFNSLPARQRLGWVSATSMAVTNAYFSDQPLFVPRAGLPHNPNQFLANHTFGSMAHGLNNFSLGNYLGLSRGSLRSAFGMGKGIINATPEGIIYNKAKGIALRMAGVTGGGFFGLMIYFSILGNAAITGFLWGATIGGLTGAGVGGFIGFQIGVALAPFTFGLSIPFFTFFGAVIGGFVGGTIGGIAGGLIAYGMASGSATAVSTGVGAGVGGTVGTYVGATAGATAGTAVGTALAAAFPPLAPLIPFFTWSGMAIGGVVGGYVGTLIGAGIGYAIGHYVIPVFNTTAISIKGLFSGAFGAGGTVGGLMSTAAGALSSAFGALAGAASGLVGGTIGALGGLMGALSSIAIPSSLAAISVGGGFLGITTLGILVGVNTAAIFSSADAEATPSAGIVQPPPGTSIGNWPTDGRVTQGPKGATDHIRLANPSIDIGNDEGTLIYSTINGSVKEVHYCATDNSCTIHYGNHVVIGDIANTFTIMHGHFSTINVSRDQPVTPDTVLGLMGNTGYSFGNHLHWEFRGIALAPPNIPEAIRPDNCDISPPVPLAPIPCTPAYVTRDRNFNQRSYWFVLNRPARTEKLYFGVPGDAASSELRKTYSVNPGIMYDDPTPLPQLYQALGRNYWTITTKIPNPAGSPMGPYFMALDVPWNNPNNGPVPYLECGSSHNEQCTWTLAGQFGLHGIGGAPGAQNKLTDAGSSGCVRHSDTDITEIYNLVDLSGGDIRYYIEQ